MPQALFKIQPTISAEDIEGEIIRIHSGKTGSEIRIKAIEVLIGPEALVETFQCLTMISVDKSIRDFLSDKPTAVNHEARLRELCTARSDELNKRIAQNPIPLQFMAVLDATALTGPFQLATMTEADWCGKYWRGLPTSAQAESSVLSRLAAAVATKPS